MSNITPFDRSFFFIADLWGKTHDPVSFLRDAGEPTPDAFTRTTTHATIRLTNKDGRLACVVFVPPRKARKWKLWQVFRTVDPMKQNEILGRDGPLPDVASGLVAALMSRKSGKEIGVFDFTPTKLDLFVTIS